MKYVVKDMTCGGCARSVTKVVQGVDPAATTVTDPASHSLEIVSAKPGAEFERALAAAGFPAVAADAA